MIAGGRSLAIAVLALGLARVCFAGAWTQPRGGYYAKLSSNYLHTENEFNYTGDRLDLFEEHPGFEDASFRDLGVTTYGEYGLTDRFTLVASFPLKGLRAERVAVMGGEQCASERFATQSVSAICCCHCERASSPSPWPSPCRLA